MQKVIVLLISWDFHLNRTIISITLGGSKSLTNRGKEFVLRESHWPGGFKIHSPRDMTLTWPWHHPWQPSTCSKYILHFYHVLPVHKSQHLWNLLLLSLSDVLTRNRFNENKKIIHHDAQLTLSIMTKIHKSTCLVTVWLPWPCLQSFQWHFFGLKTAHRLVSPLLRVPDTKAAKQLLSSWGLSRGSIT